MSFLQGIFWNRKKEKPLKLPPSRSIADAFTEYINNEIPSRFIDTSKLQFVLRKDVLRIFQDEIANVTEEQIHERMRSSLSDPLATYQPKRETILRQIIQEIVKYVVLSHRWETSGEASYQDIASGRLRAVRFKKLVEFCMTSRRLGCKLAWVDTCCIDKTNAAEHSEAIHAMYKWYANSSLCMVYLAESTSYDDWARESWFTRGWTLQELLAPRRLKFFNKDWQPFNPLGIEELFAPRQSKLFNKRWQPFNPLELDDDRKHDDVVHHLENVTGISKAVLTSDNSHGFHGRTFWEIISWASSRQTTRIEDKAYCLVGLFHVNLTITYGEGQRAFSRLVEAIAAKNPSWDVFAWFGQPSVDHFALPLSPASYPKFKTRMAEGRAGVQEFTITPIVDPDGPGYPFHVNLKPRPDKETLLGSMHHQPPHHATS
ncbi:hypothetical protein J3R82DRAFT_7298 [Butyriboletus roseoflavus]|nr:hypothetical protein J3R82DRAFT_7298 [Butyriboletus roseoflavus]